MDRSTHDLAGRIGQAIAREHSRRRTDGIVRVEVATPRIDALAWLRTQAAHHEKVFWSGRDDSYEVAGVGVADVVAPSQPDGIGSLFRTLRQRLTPACPQARYFGGIRFDERSAADPAWRHFGTRRFVLPRFELISRPRETDSILACQWLGSGPTTDELVEEAHALTFHPAINGVEAMATGRKNLPDRNEWDAAVNRTLDQLSGDGLSKLVLARKTSFEFTGELDPLSCLYALGPWSDRCYRFCFMPAPERAFLGASPELLYRREGNRIASEAVAGTCGRGDAAISDRRLAHGLLGNEKERREHDFVVRGVRESIAGLCGSLTAGGDLSVVKLRQCQHLMRAFRGVLRPGVGDVDLLKALHPTPAVGGYPSERALRHIEESESFDRGWFAGPVGWVGHDAAEFAVAIRSGLVDGTTLSVFAGAGIVAGSEPADEWHELDCKMRHFTDALNLPQ